jgi:WD40 repeat protein
MEVGFSPDGRWLATADRIGDTIGIRLWSLPDGRPGPVFPDTGRPFSFSADGRRLVGPDSAAWGPVRLFRTWEIPTGACQTVSTPWASYHKAACFSEDGAGLIVSEMLPTRPFYRLACRALATGRERWQIPGVGSDPLAGGRLITCVNGDDSGLELTIHDTTDGRLIHRISGDDLVDLQLAPDGRTLAYNRFPTSTGIPVVRWLEVHVPFLRRPTRMLALMDLSSGREETLPGGWSVRFAADGQTLAVVEDDWNCRLWDVPPRKSLTWFAAAVSGLAMPIGLLAVWRSRRLRRKAA